MALEPVATDLGEITGLVSAADGSDRLFVMLRQGLVLIYDVKQQAVLAAPFLDITDRVFSGAGEIGLLGLAFHPSYETNGFFYVVYNDGPDPGDGSVLDRFSVSPNDPDQADPSSELVLISIAQPTLIHNVSQLQFGPLDGFLYVASGDGGPREDPQGNAQNLATLLGKIWRLDVDNAEIGLDYGIPADNPFVGQPGVRQEIWAYGLRNPWRFSFDRVTGDLFIGDVGQDSREEINFQVAGQGGANFGWNLMEGNACFNPPALCNDGSLTSPILEHLHADGVCALIGGYRYRGREVEALVGGYVYGDFCSGDIWQATRDQAGQWSTAVVVESRVPLVAFGEGEAGELYVAEYSVGGAGVLYRLVSGDEIFADGFESGTAKAWGAGSR